MMNCDCGFEYYNASDPDEYYEEEYHAKSHSCICDWAFKYTGHRSGYNERTEKVNCPFHKVMF